jgi:DNA-3-methyladenine glycosylase
LSRPARTGGFDLEFLARPIETVARELIGLRLTLDNVGGPIVETEAYHHLEPASHAYPGLTARNAVMFGPIGHVYVYRSYGIHWCVNIVAGTEPGAAVLIRALEPETGIEQMRQRRRVEPLTSLCSGPGKLCQALAITDAHNGLAVNAAPFALGPVRAGGVREIGDEILVGPRIGISKAMELPWRFGLKGSPFLSRPFPNETAS